MKSSRAEELLRLQVIDFLESKIGLDVSYKRFTNKNVQLRCPFAKVSGHTKEIDSNPSLGLKITTNGFLWNCFTCHRSGRSLISFINALKKEGAITTKVSAYELQNSIEVSFPKFYEKYSFNEKEEFQGTLKDFRVLTKNFYKYNEEKRGVSKSTIKDLSIMYNRETKQVIFPCFDSRKKLHGYISHYTNGRLPKYSNNFDVGDLLYLEWLIQGDIGIICEGMYDTVVTYQHLKNLDMLNNYSVVNTLGSEVSDTQIKKMIKHFRILILFGDNDSAGIEQEKSIYNRVKSKIPLVYKLSYRGKDPATVNFSQFQNIIKKPILFNVVGE